jgi:pyruvate kinase
MLSAETSVGAYPVEAVQTMRTICHEAEDVLLNDGRLNEHYEPPHGRNRSNTESIAVAVAQIAEEKRLSAIISLSYSGETSRLISNQRPRAPIFSVTTDRSVARRIGLLWGVTGVVIESLHSTDETIDYIKGTLLKEKLFPVGATVVFTIGRPLVGRARTNMLSIESL